MPISEICLYTDFNMAAEAGKRCDLGVTNQKQCEGVKKKKSNVRERKSIISVGKEKILFPSSTFSTEFTWEHPLKWSLQPAGQNLQHWLTKTQVVCISEVEYCFNPSILCPMHGNFPSAPSSKA